MGTNDEEMKEMPPKRSSLCCIDEQDNPPSTEQAESFRASVAPGNDANEARGSVIALIKEEEIKLEIKEEEIEPAEKDAAPAPAAVKPPVKEGEIKPEIKEKESEPEKKEGKIAVGDAQPAVEQQAKPKSEEKKKEQKKDQGATSPQGVAAAAAVAATTGAAAAAAAAAAKPPKPEQMTASDSDVGRNSIYNEHGHRTIAEGMDDAPTFKYVCGVALCPGCGPAVADYYQATGNEKEDVEVPKVDLHDMKQAKIDLNAYISGVDKKPNNSTPCAAPIQFEMNGEPLSCYKQPDVVCNICSVLCCWRPMAAGYFIGYALPTLAGAKYGLGWLAVGTVMVCLFISILARILAICKPSWFRINTPSIRHIFLNVVDMKRVDVLDGEQAKKDDPTCGKLKFAFIQAWKYFKALVKGFCCCQFFRPTAIFTFAKILIAMIFTEVAMTFSAYLFFVSRFACGSGCWTLGSFAGWVREFKKSKALKKRVVNFMYPAWGFVPEEDEEPPPPELPDPESCMECIKGCLCACPCCAIYRMCGCDICCTIGCSICRPMCCEMFDMTIEVGMEVNSAIFLAGKALYYTDRILKGKKQATDKDDEV